MGIKKKLTAKNNIKTNKDYISVFKIGNENFKYV